MSEGAFRIFNSLFALGAEALYALCLALFLRPFSDQRRRCCLLSLAGSLGLRLLCDLISAPRGAFGLLLAAALTAFGGALGLEPALAFLLALLYWNARISAGLMAESLYFLLERALPPPAEPLEALFLRAAGLVSLFLITHIALFAAMLCALARRLGRRRIPLDRRTLCWLSLVPAAGILFGQVISRLLIEFRDGVLLQLYERHPGFLGAVPALAALFYLGAFLTVAFQQDLTELREEQALLFQERRQIRELRDRLRETEDLSARLRGIRHDLRDHMAALEGLARRGETDSLGACFSRLEGDLAALDPAPRTGNPVTDVILDGACRRCGDLGINLRADFRCPEGPGFDPFDLGVLLQNLLRNAEEACAALPEGDPRWITLTGRRRGRFFLVQTQNPYAGTLTRGPGGLPATAKAGELHGLGLANVRRTAEKYLGTLELSGEGQIFTASVLLQEMEIKPEPERKDL